MTRTQPTNQHLLADISELFDQAEFGLVIVDRQGIILGANQRLLSFFHCQEQQLVGHSAHYFWQSFGQQHKYRTFQHGLQGEVHWTVEMLCKSTAGRVFPVRSNWYPHPRQHDIIVGLFNDLSEQRRWQSELLESKERAERYLDISQALIVSLDTQGNVTEINRRGCQILGYEAEQLWQKNWFERAVPEVNRAEETQAYQRLIAGLDQPQCDLESEVITASGEPRVILWNHSLTTNEHGHIIGMLSSGQDITQRKAAEQEVLRLAMTDSLTGLLNRRSFHQRFREALHLAVRHNLTVSVIAIDLDNFKPVNDTHGHEMGDRVLIEVANRLQNSLRESDSIVRFGGDEFAVIAIGQHNDQGLQPLLQRLLQTLNEPMLLQGQHIEIGASIGIAQYPQHGADGDDLLHKADTALYRAKKRGRNQIAHFCDTYLQSAPDSGTAQNSAK